MIGDYNGNGREKGRLCEIPIGTKEGSTQHVILFNCMVYLHSVALIYFDYGGVCSSRPVWSGHKPCQNPNAMA